MWPMSELYQYIYYVAIIFITSYLVFRRARLMYNCELTWGSCLWSCSATLSESACFTLIF
jgi:hypothetical protein